MTSPLRVYREYPFDLAHIRHLLEAVSEHAAENDDVEIVAWDDPDAGVSFAHSPARLKKRFSPGLACRGADGLVR